jgi:glucose/arabinose dehydrogenase
MKKLSLLVIAMLCCFSLTIYAQQFRLIKFSRGYSNTVGIENCGDSRLFIVQQEGKIFICDSSGFRMPNPFLDITDRVSFKGEQGLLGLAFDPAYASNGFFYVNYINKSGNTQIARFRVSGNPNRANPNTEKFILQVNQPFNNHNGGCTRFGPDGYLYIGMGDGGSGGDPNNNSQNPMSLLGKMLRIDVHSGSNPYNIPADNPFVDSPGYRHEIWSLGLRNPWRWSFDALNGQMQIADVGQDSWEEVDVELKNSGGHNYGWRCYEGKHTYNTTGCKSEDAYTFPKYEYPHSGGDCSITGGFVYRGTKYPDLYGAYVFTDYCTGLFRLLFTEGGQGRVRTVFDGDNNAYTSFGQDYHNELYVCNVLNGLIYRVAYGKADTTVARNNGASLAFAPNPAHNNITVTYTSARSENVSVYITSFLGQKMYSVQKAVNQGANTWNINLPFARGNYYLSVVNSAGESITKNLRIE